MKWQSKHHSIQDLLKKCGFKPANRGYVLKRTKKKGDPVQYHIITFPDNVIEGHADYSVHQKRHRIERSKVRDERFIKILQDVDEGRIPVLGQKIKQHYPDLANAIEKLETEKLL